MKKSDLPISAKKMKQLLQDKDPTALLAHALSCVNDGTDPEKCELWLTRVKTWNRAGYLSKAISILEYLDKKGIQFQQDKTKFFLHKGECHLETEDSMLDKKYEEQFGVAFSTLVEEIKEEYEGNTDFTIIRLHITESYPAIGEETVNKILAHLQVQFLFEKGEVYPEILEKVNDIFNMDFATICDVIQDLEDNGKIKWMKIIKDHPLLTVGDTVIP